MQEIIYSDVNLGRESGDMRTALGWMNIWIGLSRLRTRNSPLAPGDLFYFFVRTRAVREKRVELVNAQRCVCVCVCVFLCVFLCIYINVVFRDNIVQQPTCFL